MTKGIGDKVLGWFIVQDEDVPAPAPTPAPAPAPAFGPAVVPGHPHDSEVFAAVYRAGRISDDDRERLTKVLALLESLPQAAPIDVKRSIVGAALEAFGVSIEGILTTSQGALVALDGYVAAGQTRTQEVLAHAEARIAKLTAEITEVRRLMDAETAAQQELTRATMAEQARVRTVLDFFDMKRHQAEA